MLKKTIGDSHHRTADVHYKLACEFHRLGETSLAEYVINPYFTYLEYLSFPSTCTTSPSLIKFLASLIREALTQALSTFEQDTAYDNETARAKYQMHLVLNNSSKPEDAAKAAKFLREAEDMRKTILGQRWAPTKSLEDYDELVMCWSR